MMVIYKDRIRVRGEGSIQSFKIQVVQVQKIPQMLEGGYSEQILHSRHTKYIL